MDNLDKLIIVIIIVNILFLIGVGSLILINLKFYVNKDFQEPLELLKNISERDYIKNNYNCVNFSRDYINALNKAGFEGATVTSNNHRWVCIFASSQNARPIRVIDNYIPEYFTWNNTIYRKSN